MEELLALISNLEEQEKYFQAEYEKVKQEEPDNTAKLDAFNAELQAVHAKMNDAKQKLAGLEQQHEERMKVSETEVVSIVDQFEVNGLTLRDLCAGESEYQLLFIRWQQILMGLAEKHSNEIVKLQASYEQEIDAATAENEKMVQAVAEATNRVSEAEAKANTYKSQAEDFESKLQNAVAEIERLESQVDDLRKEIAVGAKNAYKVVDTEEEKRQMQELAEKIRISRMIYDVKELDTKRSRYSAKKATTGEEFEYSYLEQTKYTVVTPEEAAQVAARFQSEQQSAEPVEESHGAIDEQDSNGENVPVVDAELPVIEAPQFQDETVVQGDGLDEGHVDGEVEGQEAQTGTATKAELEELKARVERIERQIGLERVVA